VRAALAVLLLATTVNAAEPVDVPRVPPPLPGSGRPVPRLDLPEWLAQAVGLSQSRPAAGDGRRLRWDLLPVVVSSPLVGVGAGVAAVGAFRMGDGQGTSYSSFAASALATTHSQRALDVRSELRFPRNDWILVGDWTINHFPRPAWGVGGDSPDPAETEVDLRELKLHETAYRRLVGPVYAGVGYYLDDDYDIVDLRASRGEPTAFSAYGTGTDGRSISSGFTASLLLDGRDDPLDPWRGFYALARFRFEPEWAGSERTWQSLWLEARAYAPMGRRATLAMWAYAWAAFGRTPYLMLPANGNDPEMRSARGWIQGRHVGRDLVGAEAELRFVIWEFVGGAVGGSLHSASDRDDVRGWPDFRYVSPAASAGVRLTLDRRSLASLAFDLAWRPGGLGGYVAFNQAF
jgi:hypothetical protein